MTDNFMNQLKKELIVIHDSINNYGKYPETGNSKYCVWGSYDIVINNGTVIHIDMQSRFFPNFNFNKIALIIKRDCSYTDDDGERFFDSEVGEYISEVKNMYSIETQFVIFTSDED